MATFFKNIKTLEDLKSQYRQLAIINHPDKGGSTETMQRINNEYDMLFKIYKYISKDTSSETSESTRSEFYTQHGFKGSRYNEYTNNKDLAKTLREFLKIQYGVCKFSVISDYLEINVSLMSAPWNVFTDQLNEYDNSRKYIQINHYYIENEKRLTEIGKDIFTNIYNFLKMFHFNDSDSMIDYFNTNFYMHFEVGRWNKPFQVIEKTLRIKESTKEIVKN